jgi:Cu+-exporting ATPase
MTKDLVCGMDVDPQKAAAQSIYHGRTYYFCSIVCKGMFEREPEKYAIQANEEQQNQQDHHHNHSH